MEVLMTHLDLSFVMLLIGMALGAQRSSRDQLNNPQPLQIAGDVETAIHALKSILINHSYDGSRWRLLQIDTGVGQLVACLDHMDAQRDPRTNEFVIVRTQLMLLSEFKEEGPNTLAKLSWHVRSQVQSDVCTQLIADTTELISSQLAKQFPPAMISG
jgi:hypothetical protein